MLHPPLPSSFENASSVWKVGKSLQAKKKFFYCLLTEVPVVREIVMGVMKKIPRSPFFPFVENWNRDTGATLHPPHPHPPPKKKEKEKGKNGNVVPVRHRITLQMKPKELLLLLLSLILAVCGKRIVGQREINPLPGKSWCFVRFVRWIDGGKKERKSGKTTSAKLEFWMLECRVGDLNMERKSIKIHHVCALIQRQILFFFFVPTLTTFFFGCRWERSDAIHWWSKNGFPRKFPLSYGTHASTHHGSPSPFFCTRRTGIK